MEEKLTYRFGHLGFSADNEIEAREATQTLWNLFQFCRREEETAIYSGEFIEVLKQPTVDQKGHIGILTNHMDAAMEDLENRGFTFDRNRFKYDKNGKLVAAYLFEKILGFSVHLSEESFE